MSIISALLKVKEYYGEKAVIHSNVAKFARDSFRQMLNDGKCRVFAIVVLNKKLGRIVLFTNLDDKDLANGETVCHFSNLWVHPKLRGHKIGSKLVRVVETEARKNGFEFLTLGVHPDNEKNMRMYSRMGFDMVVKNKSQDIVAKDRNGNYIKVKENTILMKKL